MKAKLIPAIVAVAAILPVAGQAATQTGNLTVTTTIQVSCDAPSPSGTLVLPFDSAAAIGSQSLAATPVTVTVTCYGNPIVNHVDFGNGANRANVTEAESFTRYMKRDGADGTSPSHYLGYRLWAKAGVGATSSVVSAGTGGSMGVGTGATANDNRLLINASSGNFQVTGVIREGAERTGAFGNPNLAVSGGLVPGGTYNDTVVMTIDYN